MRVFKLAKDRWKLGEGALFSVLINVDHYLARVDESGCISVGDIRGGSLAERLGLKSGDKVKAVNGKRLIASELFPELGSFLEHGRKMHLEVERNGRTHTFIYSLTRHED